MEGPGICNKPQELQTKQLVVSFAISTTLDASSWLTPDISNSKTEISFLDGFKIE